MQQKYKNILISNIDNRIGFPRLLGIAIILIIIGIAAIFNTLYQGISLFGLSNTISWGWMIACFIFWVGIAHAGTLISAILFLAGQHWRSSLSRSAEAMTVIAIMIAAVFPLIHTGRPWYAFYWLIPYPNQMGVWTNYKSPLEWDFFAIMTYLIISLAFFYIGLLPDLAYLRNRLKNRYIARIYKHMSLGFSGNPKQWSAYLYTYSIVAGIAAAVVVSVHSIVSLDFAVTLLPGWHSTIFPPYFVAGAILSGCAFVIMLIVILRHSMNLINIIKIEHLEKLNKIIIAMSWIIGYSYTVEFFHAFSSGSSAEANLFTNRLESGVFILVVIFCFALPQLLLFSRIRKNTAMMFIISIMINIGMMAERYEIVISSQYSAHYSSITGSYMPTITELSIFAGSIGIFMLMFIGFIRYFPPVSIWETEYYHK
ncbi:MAG: NrfD/PsrC family molybdoenzyme membrane anchor subunit [Candidatus Kapaibacterium sp.]